ncbi:putative peptidase C14, caspase catalytic [Crocosphaera subtropica ATCC 51142]|uniref:Peptidase C14, caspase catalytic n=1 Tax=Crocosphaera subtropica (strain ATCC 51142 / BH68) TaxID=43989 RepID=B1WW77_CROS5|nr:caspase family protein [Crocosphaera subtropica]ACB54005.1 putative peptidase C14, caspase catalytic [Crocosphaera subtropica ATCC 51142]
MKWDRRTFLQTLLTWGVAQESLTRLNPTQQFQKYYQTLAEPTHRKLALLVGINDYGQGFNLKGCVTDVERQKDLLIHRFGFNPQDILTVTDKEATRQGIETAFVEHLIKQAKAGDVVIFHFSGYGNYINIPPDIVPTLTKGQLPGIIAKDGITLNNGNPSTDNILEDTLRLLGRSLSTDKVTMVLDTSYHSSGHTVQGNLRVRSFPYPTDNIEREEFTFQAELKQKLPKSKAGTNAGIILSAAGSQQLATEIKGNGFSAGLFTYALTQHLWSTVPASRLNITLNKTTEQILPIMGGKQEPQQENSPSQPLFTYYLLPPVSQGAEAFISSVEDSARATMTLTGFPANIVRYYGTNSIFYPLNSSSSSLPLQLRSRNGLTAKVRQLSSEQTPSEPLAVGQLLQESLRCLPQSIGLTVALDPQLQRIERVDATSAFSAIDIVSDVLTEGEQPIDCILGLRSSFSSPSSQTQETGTYSLFLPGGVQLPNTLGKSGEAIKSAIERLRPTLEKLLAMKLWGLTLNEGSSQVPWRVTLEGLDPKPYAIEQRQTIRAKIKTVQQNTDENTNETSALNVPGLPKVPRGTRLRYRLENLGEQPLYYLVLGINSSGKAIAYVPPYEEEIEASENDQRLIEPGMKDFIPATSTGLTWTTSSTKGWEHIVAIAAIAPFQKTLETLKGISEFKTDKDQILTLENPLEVAKALLQDLETASNQTNTLLDPNPDSYILDVKAWSTLSFIYQVI